MMAAMMHRRRKQGNDNGLIVWLSIVSTLLLVGGLMLLAL